MISKANNPRGYTLLEVMIAMVILSVGILATSKLQISFMQSNTKSITITEGSAQVQTKIEELINLPYASLANGNDIVQVGGDGRIYNFTWAVTPDSPFIGTSTIDVLVAWNDENQVARNVTYTFTKTDLYTGAEW